tara:strand:- start:1864 stop:2553 length:690 start_codon:yes stop_codon:yes gene_type:complete
MKDIESIDRDEPTSLLPSEIRLCFIRKVYTILALQLLTSSVICGITLSDPRMQLFILDNNVLTVSMFTTIGTICAMICYSHKHPWNILLLGMFTIAESFILSRTCLIFSAQYGTNIILISASMTSGIFLLLTFITFVTNRDFSFMGNMLIIALFTLIGFMFIQIFTQSVFINTLIAWFGVMIFSGYIIYDTSQILHKLGPDDCVHASLMLYLDIVNIFLLLLNLLRGSD